MTIEQRIVAFSGLSVYLFDYIEVLSGKEDRENEITGVFEDFNNEVLKSRHHNPWFTMNNLIHAIRSIADSITYDNLTAFVSNYDPGSQIRLQPSNVGVVMAGNIPAVGFHDFLCVLISGNSFVGKCSSNDQFLLPAIAQALIKIEPGFEGLIHFCDDKLTGFNAVIATGSNNTSRYFDYYFAKYPNIIRKNRNGVGVITGDETIRDIEDLAKDIFIYFGLGCRNISKIYIPEGYNPTRLFEGFNGWDWLANNHKYRNNYDYYRSIFMINIEPFFDNGFVLLREEQNISSPVSVINYDYYKDINDVNNRIKMNSDKIQCVVSIDRDVSAAIPPGTAQSPGLADFADGIDTMEFCLGL